MKAIFFSLMICFSLSATAFGQTTYKLWPNSAAPGAKGNTSADTPSVTVYFPPAGVTANGAAVLVCPGGGYSFVAGDYEGKDVAVWFAQKGFMGVVLKYRVYPYMHPIPMKDGQRAIRFMRSKAKQWNIDTSKIGIVGFSAGGHLASTLVTHWAPGNPTSTDSIERQGCKPHFGIFVYPVITMDASFTHAGSRSSLIGSNPSQALIDSLSNEKQVTSQTGPAYLVHGIADYLVPWKNSQVYFDSCTHKNVKAHFYKITASCGGEHGFGLSCGSWADSSYAWLTANGVFDSPVSTQKSFFIKDPRRLDYNTLSNRNTPKAVFDFSGRSLGTLNISKRNNYHGVYLVQEKQDGKLSGPVSKVANP